MKFTRFQSLDKYVFAIYDISHINCDLLVNIVKIIADELSEDSDSIIIVDFSKSTKNSIDYDDLRLVSEYTKSIAHLIDNKKCALILNKSMGKNKIYSWVAMINSYIKNFQIKSFYNIKIIEEWFSINLPDFLKS